MKRALPSRQAVAPANGATLPAATDADAGVQLQLPSKLLGCLRTVGQPTCRNSNNNVNPLLVVAVYDAANIIRVDVKLVDVAAGGAVVAQLDGQGNGLFGATGGLICVVGNGGTAAISVLDPATGDVTNIRAPIVAKTTSSSYVFGHVPATGEHKILRVYAADGQQRDPSKQSCEILTLGGSGKQQRWRPAQRPPVLVGTAIPRHRAVTRGVVHFLIPQRGAGAGYDFIASFDMASEEWRPALLRCPLSSVKRNCCSSALNLAELNGCLVFVHHDYLNYAMDMWVLAKDLGKGTWLRVEPLPLGKIIRSRRETKAQPLMVLEDGRIAFWVQGASNGVVRVYNPRTGGCEEVVNFGRLSSVVGLHRGGLLGFN